MLFVLQRNGRFLSQRGDSPYKRDAIVFNEALEPLISRLFPEYSVMRGELTYFLLQCFNVDRVMDSWSSPAQLCDQQAFVDAYDRASLETFGSSYDELSSNQQLRVLNIVGENTKLLNSRFREALASGQG